MCPLKGKFEFYVREELLEWYGSLDGAKVKRRPDDHVGFQAPSRFQCCNTHPVSSYASDTATKEFHEITNKNSADLQATFEKSLEKALQPGGLLIAQKVAAAAGAFGRVSREVLRHSRVNGINFKKFQEAPFLLKTAAELNAVTPKLKQEIEKRGDMVLPSTIDEYYCQRNTHRDRTPKLGPVVNKAPLYEAVMGVNTINVNQHEVNEDDEVIVQEYTGLEMSDYSKHYPGTWVEPLHRS